MPFERVGKIRVGNNPDLITMSVNQSKSNKTLNIHLGSAVAANAGLSMDEKAEVLWGYEDDLGILVLCIPEEEGVGVKFKDNKPRLTHSTTRVPEWVLPFSTTECEILSSEKGALTLKLPKEDEVMKRAPLASSDIKKPKKTSDPKITVTHKDDDQPPTPEPTAENTFERETKRGPRDRFRTPRG